MKTARNLAVLAVVWFSVAARAVTVQTGFGQAQAEWDSSLQQLVFSWTLTPGNGSVYGQAYIAPISGPNGSAGTAFSRVSAPPGNGPNTGTYNVLGAKPGDWFRIKAADYTYGDNALVSRDILEFQVDASGKLIGTIIWDPAAQAAADQDRITLAPGTGAVQLATGAEATSRSLFSFLGARNWGFTIRYNSVLATAQSAPGVFGYGWTHNFESRIEVSGAQMVLHWDALSANRFSLVSGSSDTYTCSQDGAQYDTLTALSGGGWLLVRKDQSQLRFDANGLLIEDRDANGRKLVLTYSGGKLTEIVEPVSGTHLAFTYDGAGTIASVADALDASVAFTYAGSPRVLTAVTNQNGKVVTFGYGASAAAVLLQTLTDNEGHCLTTNTYDSSGRVQTQQQPSGKFSFFYTTADTAQTSVIDRNGATWDYAFDYNGNMSWARSPVFFSKAFGYDSHNQLTSEFDELNHSNVYTYDARGNLLTVTDPAGKLTKFTYDDRNNLLTVTDPVGSVTTRTYDANNNLLSLTTGTGSTTSWTYDGNSLPLTMTLPGDRVYSYAYTDGRLTESTDPTGVVTKFGYDVDGRVLYREDALGKRTSFTYDAVGNLLTTVDPLDHTTSYEYDSHNRLVKTTDGTGAATNYTYDLDGNLITVSDPLGKITRFTYDASGRLLTTTDPLNRTTTRAYDSAGRLLSITDPAGKKTTFERDASSRITAIVDALGSRATITYDDRSKITGMSNNARTEQYAYDDAGRVTSINNYTALTYDAANRLVKVNGASQEFDAAGNRVAIKNPSGNATAFSYDTAGRLIGTTTAEGHGSVMAFDERGMLKSLTSPSGKITHFSYDDAGRLSSITDDVGTDTFTRDAVSRVLTVTENGKTLERKYDLAGRLTSFTDSAGNVIGYQYDDCGRLTKLTYPGGKQVTYGYDANGRLSAVTDWANRVTSYTYNDVGQLTKTDRPNGTKQTLDNAGEPSVRFWRELGSDGMTVIFSADYDYDTQGRLRHETVTPVVMPGLGSAVQTFDRDNRLLTHNGSAVTYDDDGNLIHIASGVAPVDYTYDARNRLIAAGELTYGYDAEDRRVAVTDSSGTAKFSVDPNSQVLVRTAPDGTTTYYVYGLGLLYEETGAAVRYYHYDHRGDTVALTDSAGAVTDRFSYGVYGDLISHTGTSTTPFCFNGRWGVQSDRNGLYFNRARYYHPVLHRFLNQDTLLGAIGLPISLNRYAYANGNPVSLIDPFGRMAQDASPSGFWSWAYGLIGIDLNARYSLTSLGKSDDSVALMSDLGISPSDMSPNLFAYAASNLITEAAETAACTIGSGLIVRALEGGAAEELVLAKRAATEPVAAESRVLRSNADLVQEVATRAEQWGVNRGYGAAGTGPVQGTFKHGYADRLLQRYQRMEEYHTGFQRGLQTETSWLNHARVTRGTSGSARLDVWDASTGTVFDYKFVRNPGLGLGTRQINHINNNGPLGILQILEVNP